MPKGIIDAVTGKSAKDASRAAEQSLAEQTRYNNAQLLQTQEQLELSRQAQQDQLAAFEAQELFNLGQLGMLAEQNHAQQEQFAVSREAAEKQAKQNEETLNRSLAKRPNSRKILSSARQASKTGVSGTLLTGAGGIDKGSLKLGHATPLGA